MGRIIYLMGKSSSGKDTIFKELLETGKRENKAGRNLCTIVPYTTRPIREGERDGVEYHFTDEEGYRKWEASGKVIEQREYHTFHGTWRYFTVDDGQFDPGGEQDYIMIGTLESYQSMRKYFGTQNVLPVLIELDDGVRLRRALDRESRQGQPRYEEMCRRFLADQEDFSEEKLNAAGIKRHFHNDDLAKCLEEIREYICGE